jgi:predicted DNA-binding mobile mystery protein A
MNKKALTLRQADTKFEKIRPISIHLKGVKSWIKYIRSAMGMSADQLAKKTNMATSSLYQLERGEEENKVNLQSLKKVAEALNCEVIYALVPREPLNEMIKRQAYTKAKNIVAESTLNMELEDQAVNQVETKQQIKELADKIRESKNLWSDS